jgi:hypothetical protein
VIYGKLGNEVRIVSQRKSQARAAAQATIEQFLAAFDRVIDER